jgi:hypothetical protein
MNFGQAIERMKTGAAVRRDGWVGNRLVYMERGSADFAASCVANPALELERFTGLSATLFAYGDTGTCTRLPHLVDALIGCHSNNGFVPTQQDMLAEDWCVTTADDLMPKLVPESESMVPSEPPQQQMAH